MVEFEVLFIESMSIVIFMMATFLIFQTLLSRFKGMKTPPFWIYLFSGFFIITFHGVLNVVNISFQFFPAYAISLLRLVGNLAVLMGVYKLYKTQSASIKFDQRLEE